MQTDRRARSFELDYGPPGAWFKRPRLWRLALGLLCTASAALPVAWVFAGYGWEANPDTGSGLVIGALGAIGAALILNAVTRDLLHVESASFSSDGIRLRYSYVPRVWGIRDEKEHLLAWHDVVHLEWQEGGLEHDLKQHLVLGIATPPGRGHERLKLLVCDERNASHCEALMSHLPTSVETPCWLVTTRLRREDNST